MKPQKKTEKPKCNKCGTEIIHVLNANKGKMEKRCECEEKS